MTGECRNVLFIADVRDWRFIDLYSYIETGITTVRAYEFIHHTRGARGTCIFHEMCAANFRSSELNRLKLISPLLSRSRPNVKYARRTQAGQLFSNVTFPRLSHILHREPSCAPRHVTKFASVLRARALVGRSKRTLLQAFIISPVYSRHGVPAESRHPSPRDVVFNFSLNRA